MTAAPADQTVRDRRIGLSYESNANLFYRDLGEGVRAAAAARGVDVILRECGGSTERQSADIVDLLDAGIDVLMISPLDEDAVAPALVAARARHVPVFTVDRAAGDAAADAVICHVTSDNRLGGRLAADVLVGLLGGAGEVAIVGRTAGTSFADRIAGFRAALERHEGIRLVTDGAGAYDRHAAHDETTALLRAHPRVAGIFATNDITVLGVIDAVRDAGRAETVAVVGYDATPQSCEEIMRGAPLRAEVAQFPARIGRRAVELWADDRGGVVPAPRVEIPVEVVTQENVERFTGAERLLHTRRGEVWTAGERVIFFPVRGYQMMLDEIHAASPDLLRHIVYRSGFVLGESIARQVQELYPDPRDRLFVLLEDLARGGFGTFELLSLDHAAGQAEVRGHNLFETAIAPGLAWVRTPRAVDTYCSGRLAGYLTAIIGRPAACEEVLCQARGDACCQFAITAEEG